MIDWTCHIDIFLGTFLLLALSNLGIFGNPAPSFLGFVNDGLKVPPFPRPIFPSINRRPYIPPTVITTTKTYPTSSEPTPSSILVDPNPIKTQPPVIQEKPTTSTTEKSERDDYNAKLMILADILKMLMPLSLDELDGVKEVLPLAVDLLKFLGRLLSKGINSD
ncbi:hypothetical protein HHI36_021255 [Cryptolaemus montrouzieri]|uniref:Uncharacterized protein n=1 Tax=Cryptolaemus montrouzieri TaxID=559131 RepID=A0ABD2MWC6_9CUCU